MTVETRGRSTSDTRGTPGGRGGRPYRGYGAYTSGANALRLDTIDPDIDDDDAPVTAEPRVAPRPARTPAPSRVPRPRRRTPWVSDVTPVALPEAPPLPVNLPRAPFVALLVGLVVVGVVGVLVLHTKINEGSFRLSDLRSTQAALDQQEQQLEQQLADLSQPGNLRAAATRLGLVEAEPAHIYLPDGRVVGVPQPAGR
jgi:hypothetical protein